jgi:hypothetical protein
MIVLPVSKSGIAVVKTFWKTQDCCLYSATATLGAAKPSGRRNEKKLPPLKEEQAYLPSAGFRAPSQQ